MIQKIHFWKKKQKQRKENQEVMWDPVFSTPDYTLTKWEGDVKVVKTATETPNNLLLLKSRAYDADNNLLWGHEDTWDATFYENRQQTKELYFAPGSTSESDKKVDYQNEGTCHLFYDQEGLDDGDFNRKRHYTLEGDQLKVDWAHKNTYDLEYNKDKLVKRKKYFNDDGSVNWQFVANTKECTFDAKYTYENRKAVSFSRVPVPEEDHAAEDELQNYKLEAYKLVQEEDVVKVVNKLMTDETFALWLVLNLFKCMLDLKLHV